jgi:hypothetical protein
VTTLAYAGGMPTPGTTLNSIADPEIVSAFASILAWANGNIDGVNVAATLTGRRLVFQAFWLLGSNLGANTWFADSRGSADASGSAPVGAVAWAYLDPAGFAVTGKTNTQLVLRMSLATSTIAPTVNFTAQLNAVTFGGASSGLVTPTAGSLVTGSAVTINAPAASSGLVIESAPFTFPTAGAYAPIVITSGTTAANSGTNVTVQLFALNS